MTALSLIKRGLLLLCIPSLSFLLPNLAQAQEVKTIELQHRQAEEVLPLLRPFLAEGGVMTGAGSQIFIQTTLSNLSTLHKLIDQLDRKPAQLLITVLQDLSRTQLQQRFGLTQTPALGAIITPQGMSHLIVSTHHQENRRQEQQLRILSGSRATIESVQAQSVLKDVYAEGNHTLELPAAEFGYETVSTGYHILARLNGDDEVQVEITPYSGKIEPTRDQTKISSEQHSVLRVPLNQWVVIGLQGRLRNQETRFIASAGGPQREHYTVIKIEKD